MQITFALNKNSQADHETPQSLPLCQGWLTLDVDRPARLTSSEWFSMDFLWGFFAIFFAIRLKSMNPVILTVWKYKMSSSQLFRFSRKERNQLIWEWIKTSKQNVNFTQKMTEKFFPSRAKKKAFLGKKIHIFEWFCILQLLRYINSLKSMPFPPLAWSA